MIDGNKDSKWGHVYAKLVALWYNGLGFCPWRFFMNIDEMSIIAKLSKLKYQEEKKNIEVSVLWLGDFRILSLIVVDQGSPIIGKLWI